MKCAVCHEPAAKTCCGCPFEPDEEPVCQCEKCFGPLYCGDRFYDFDGTMICTECVDDMSGTEMAEFLGYHSQELTWNEIENRRQTHED